MLLSQQLYDKKDAYDIADAFSIRCTRSRTGSSWCDLLSKVVVLGGVLLLM